LSSSRPVSTSDARRPFGVEDTIDTGSAWFVTLGRSRVGRHRPNPGEPSHCSLPFVVRHECIDWSEIGSGCHVDRVQGTEHGFCEDPGGEEQATIEWRQAKAVDRLPSPRHQDVQRQTLIPCHRSADGPRHLGQDDSQETRSAPSMNVRSAWLSGSSTTSLAMAEAST
jgi:hypothetical protein